MPAGDQFFVKFAWSRPAALQLAHEIGVLAALLAAPGPAVLVHGDLHGDNQVWAHGELRLVMDFATAAGHRTSAVDDLAARFRQLGIVPVR